MADKTPATPKRPRTAGNVAVSSPSKARLAELDKEVDQLFTPAECEALLKPIFKQISEYAGDRPNIANGLGNTYFDLLYKFFKINNLDRGMLLDPEVEAELIERGRQLGIVEAMQEREEREYRSDVEDDDGVDDEQVVVSSAPAAQPTAVIDDIARMFSEETMTKWKLKANGDGSSREEYKVIGTEGVPEITAVTTDLSSSVRAETVDERKQAFVNFFIKNLFHNQIDGTMRWVKPHPWVTFMWANMLFDTIGTGGLNNIRAVVTGFLKKVEGGFHQGVVIQAKRLAKAETNAVLRNFYQSFADSTSRASTKDSLYHLMTAYDEINLIHGFTALVDEMANPHSSVRRRVETHERTHFANKRGRKYKDQVKSYLASQLNVDQGSLSLKFHRARPIAAVLDASSLGFLALLPASKLMKFSKMCCSMTEDYLHKFYELNPEVTDLARLVELKFVKPLLKNDVDRMKQLKAQEIEKIRDCQTKLQKYLGPPTTEAGEDDDQEMTDA